MKTGLILDGGGQRGIYTAGVLDVFMEHSITFDGVIGVSAGSIHGCSYVSKQKGRIIRQINSFISDKKRSIKFKISRLFTIPCEGDVFELNTALFLRLYL